MSQEDYDEYEEGFHEGEEVAEEEEEGKSFGEVAEEQLGRLLVHDRYAGKSEIWWKGFEDGKVAVSSFGTRDGVDRTLSRAPGPSHRKIVRWNPSRGV